MNKKRVILNVIFFGAIWGILEATLGYVLHWMPNMIQGGIMFPIGAILMFWAYRNTNSKTAIIYVGLIAAMIKAVNFLMPYPMALKIYNPMISIMIQALVIFATVLVFEKKTFPVQVGAAMLSSLVWRSLFIVNQVINRAIIGETHDQLASSDALLSFIFINAIFEILLLGALFTARYFLSKKVKWSFTPHWLVSLSTFAAAIILVLVL